jgi:hypothetical protein
MVGESCFGLDAIALQVWSPSITVALPTSNDTTVSFHIEYQRVDITPISEMTRQIPI